MNTNDEFVTIKILDEINVAIMGLRNSEIKLFMGKCSVKAKNYFFSPLYKAKKWDGKYYFFDKAGKTYLHLLPSIVPDLKKLGYKLKLIDERKTTSNYEFPLIDKFYVQRYPKLKEIENIDELGDHQVHVVNALIKNNNSGLIKAGTGSGKTIITGILADMYFRHHNLNTLIIVPTIDLVDQTYSELKEKMGLDVGFLSEMVDTNHPIVVSTWQSLQNNKGVLAQFQAIIVDECHGVTGGVLREILNTYGSHVTIKVGLTGTLPTEEFDLMCVRITLGDVIYEVPAHELIKSGWLAKLNLTVIQLEENLTSQYEHYIKKHKADPDIKAMTYTKFKDFLFSEYQEESKYIDANKSRNEFIANLINDARCKKGNTLVLVKAVAYGKKLAKLIPNSIFIHGKDSKEVRKVIYEEFSTKNDIVLIATQKLVSTGLNIKRIFNIFLLDSGKSSIKLIQSIGRGLRKAVDKFEVFVYDVCSDLKYARRHLSLRKKYYNTEQYPFTVKKIEYKNESNEVLEQLEF